MKMKTVTLHPAGQERILQGKTLLTEKDFLQLPAEEGLVTLLGRNQKVLGQAYLAKENRGVGWFLGPNIERLDQAFFATLFSKAKKKRQDLASSSQTTAYRVFHQDGDGFGGLTIDVYGDYAVFSWYNSFVKSLEEEIVSAFQQVFPEIVGGYEKIRFKGLDYETAYLFGQEAPETFLIKENGVAYQVFLNDGLMTGIFLDQHQVRKSLVDGLATGKSLLNLFSYTAAFSVAAAMGGAAETTSVDLAKRSRELSEAHFVANGLSLDNHRLVVMDVFEYFRYAKRKGLTYDVIVIDPPSFARNKKQTFSVAKDYHRLVEGALDILSPSGRLILSTNAANLSRAKFKEEIEKGLGQVSYRYEHEYRLPSDFQYNKKDESSNYLKVFTIQVEK